MRRRWTLFAYPVMDIKAAEAMLNRRAAEGWRLEKVWLGLLASFVPAAEAVCYCLDWYDPNKEDGLDYRTLLADAGWRRVGQLSYWNLYEAPAGTAPIQTDGELEYRRFRKKALRRMAIGWGTTGGILAVLALLLGAAAIFRPGALDWRFFVTLFTGTNTGAMILLLLPLLLPGGLLWSGRLLLRLGQWKHAIAREEPFPVPGPGSALAARLCTLAGYVLLIPLVLALVLDTLGKQVSMGWLIGGIVGCAAAWSRAEGPEYRRRQRYSTGTLACLVVLLALRLLPLSGLTAPFLVTPPLAGENPFPPAELEKREDERTFLAAHTEWTQWMDLSSVVSGVRLVSNQGEGWVLPWGWLADYVEGRYRGELGPDSYAPLEGYEAVWVASAERDGDFYLIRRENTVLWLEPGPGTIGTQWLDDLLARLEEDGA